MWWNFTYVRVMGLIGENSNSMKFWYKLANNPVAQCHCLLFFMWRTRVQISPPPLLLSIAALVQGWCWPTCQNRETKNQRHNAASENEELLAGKPCLLQMYTPNLHVCFLIAKLDRCDDVTIQQLCFHSEQREYQMFEHDITTGWCSASHYMSCSTNV